MQTEEPSIRFWQTISDTFLNQLCHLPDKEIDYRLPSPEIPLLDQWILQAPLMCGGEYLHRDTLLFLWLSLNQWIEHSIPLYGNLTSLLDKIAPNWQQVGRVSFHLAENKKDPDRPFAFLATYATGLGTTGKLKCLPLKNALQEYTGSNNRSALINLLTPIDNAAQKCPWIQELVSSGQIYQPIAWTAEKAYTFLCSTSQMEASGLTVRIPNWWKKRSRPQVSVTLGSSKIPSIGIASLLDFQVELRLGEDKLSLEELNALLITKEKLIYLRGQWVEVDAQKLQQALDHWKKVEASSQNGQISFAEGMRLLSGAPTSLSTPDTEDTRLWTHINPGSQLAEVLKNLRNPSSMTTDGLENPHVLLRSYQKDGVNWLYLLSELGLGGCLADDMGLGKTIQLLSLLLKIKSEGRHGRKPSLLIAPASLLSNWKKESERFTPTLNLHVLHPSERDAYSMNALAKQESEILEKFDLILTTYSMAVRLQWLRKIDWNLLILDEAQAIKNDGTKQTQAIKAIKARARIALTGTPIENRLSDLWSLFDFINPGLLGPFRRFKEYMHTTQNDAGPFQALRTLIAPYILRRMKTDSRIITELPNKIETATYCQLTKKQASLYQATINELRRMLKEIEPKNRRGLILSNLMQLKQICNHPSQHTGDLAYIGCDSGKFERLGEICQELAARQEKVLVFTQFSEIIPHLETYLSQIFGRKGLSLHGKTPIHQRKELVEQFQQDNGPPFFILSLRAGGTGLTLTAASHVIHFDRWWNPAVENQATDRAFRIGQKKNVQVHKFITQGTLEEHIDEMIQAKTKLSEDILSTSDEIRITELADDALLDLISLNIDRSSIDDTDLGKEN